MITIQEVKTKKQIKEFIEFPLKLYKGSPYFVPPLYMEERNMFKPNFAYNDQCEHVFFNAYRDGKMVGRISGILQHASNEKWKQKRVRFTRFDSINDIEVAKALFGAVQDWARAKGMTEIVGPLGYSDLEREGLLIEGFDQLSTFEEQYNYDYYPKLIESLGFVKEVDWIESKLTLPAQENERLRRMSELVMRRYKLHLDHSKNTRQFLKNYADDFFEIMDITYNDIYGTVPMTERMKKMMISNFKLMVDPRFVSVILDENDKVVCFGLCLPSISKAVQKSGGRLTLPAIFKLLKSIKHPHILDLALIGVLPEYAKKGVSSVLLYEMTNILRREKIAYAETNLNLENNLNIRNMWKNFDTVEHKRRRCYVKPIENKE